MKKILSLSAAFVIAASVLSTTAYADGNDLKSTFFPSGMINAPERAPYIAYTDRDEFGDAVSSETCLYYDLSSDLLNMNNAYAVMGENEFSTEYGVMMNTCGIQVDVKFDDQPWLSEQYNFDRFDYGETIDPDDNIFLLKDTFDCDDTDRVHFIDQSWLVYYDELPEAEEGEETEDDASYRFIRPYVKSNTDEYDITTYQFNTAEHSILYRYRYFVTYYPDDAADYDTDDGNVIFSGWSPETVLGSSMMPAKPSFVNAPVISEFALMQDEYDCYTARFNLSVPQNVYDAIRYFYIAEDFTTDAFEIETQMRINGGEWIDIYTEDSFWINDGKRSAVYGDGNISEKSEIELRTRFACTDGSYSDWSNIIGAKPETIPEYMEEALDIKVPAPKVTDANGVVVTDKNGIALTEKVDCNNMEDDPDSDLDDGYIFDGTAGTVGTVTDAEGNIIPEAGKDSEDKDDNSSEPKKNNAPVIIIILSLVIIAAVAAVIFLNKKKSEGKEIVAETDENDDGK